MLLRTVAITASARAGTEELHTAEEKLGEAIAQLAKIDAVKKLAGSIQQSVAKIDSGCTTIGITIHRLLDEALTALASAESSTTEPQASTPGVVTGVA